MEWKKKYRRKGKLTEKFTRKKGISML